MNYCDMAGVPSPYCRGWVLGPTAGSPQALRHQGCRRELRGRRGGLWSQSSPRRVSVRGTKAAGKAVGSCRGDRCRGSLALSSAGGERLRVQEKEEGAFWNYTWLIFPETRAKTTELCSVGTGLRTHWDRLGVRGAGQWGRLPGLGSGRHTRAPPEVWGHREDRLPSDPSLQSQDQSTFTPHLQLHEAVETKSWGELGCSRSPQGVCPL